MAQHPSPIWNGCSTRRLPAPGRSFDRHHADALRDRFTAYAEKAIREAKLRRLDGAEQGL